MDKAIFLFDSDVYTPEQIDQLTWKDCEEWVAEEDYEDNYTILKIDANSYKSVLDALVSEGYQENDYLIKAFGF